MERLTERHEYNGKNHISVDREKNGITCSNYCTSCRKADCDDIRAALFKLAEYEDLEKQDLLLRLPCKVGDEVYALQVDEEKFEHFHCGVKIKKIDFDFWMIPLLGKTVFLTQSEAEEALRKMNESEVQSIEKTV